MSEILTMPFAGDKQTRYIEGARIIISSALNVALVNYANLAAENYGITDIEDLTIFKPEETMVHKSYGVPTLVGRVDFTVTNPQFTKQGKSYLLDGNFNPYELEERPAGKGVMSNINPEIGENLISILKPGEKTICVVSPERLKRNNFDDNELANFVCSDDEAQSRLKNDPNLQILGRDMKGCRLSQYRQNSVSTIDSEGEKGYQFRMDPNVTIDGSQIEDGQPFLVQPRTDASKAYGIRIYHPDPEFRNRVIESDQRYLTAEYEKGLKEARKTNAKSRSLLKKPLAMPIDISSISKGEGISEIDRFVGICRIYVMYDIMKKTYKNIGGAFMARPEGSIIIHGTQDCITIPINTN